MECSRSDTLINSQSFDAKMSQNLKTSRLSTFKVLYSETNWTRIASKNILYFGWFVNQFLSSVGPNFFLSSPVNALHSPSAIRLKTSISIINFKFIKIYLCLSLKVRLVLMKKNHLDFSHVEIKVFYFSEIWKMKMTFSYFSLWSSKNFPWDGHLFWVLSDGWPQVYT